MKDVSATILSDLNYQPKIPGKCDYRVGVVGVGRIALGRQIPAYHHMGLKVVAGADIKQEALDAAREEYGIDRGFLDYRQMLELDDVDIVDICTNTFPRKQITLDAIAAGKHVISEKPFARSYADALEIVEAAEKAGVKLAVHQPTRWYYPCGIARELVRKGYIGDVYYIECRLNGNQDTLYYEDPVTRWHADLNDHIFVEWGAHYFDLQRWFAMGETPQSVFAWGTRKGNENFKSKMAVSATCHFRSQIVGNLSLNQTTRFPAVCGPQMWFCIEGTEGVVAGDIIGGLEFRSRADGGIEGNWNWTERLSKEEDPRQYMWNASIRDGHVWPMVELVNVINGDSEGRCSGRDNLETVATYLAAMKSDEEYRPVDPQEIKDECK